MDPRRVAFLAFLAAAVMLPATARGAVDLKRIDVRDYRLADLRNQFSIVLQEPVLFSTTVAENIAYGHPLARRLHSGGVELEEIDERRLEVASNCSAGNCEALAGVQPAVANTLIERAGCSDRSTVRS